MGARENDIKECFMLFDKEGAGQIPSEELGRVVRSLGQNPTEAEVDEMVKNMIKKNSFNVNELGSVMSRLNSNPRNKEEEIREAFRVFDRDNNGCIAAAELRHVMTNIGEKLSEKEVDEMLREMSVDTEGFVSYEDVIGLMCA